MKKRRSLTIIITSALLLELVSLIQYSYMRAELARQLEYRAETELTMKAISILNTLDLSERMLKSHIRNLKQDLENPDSVAELALWIVKMHPRVIGCGMAFKPYYYPEKGRLFEPYAQRTDSGIILRQVAAGEHDYTKRGFYKAVYGSDQAQWIGPYLDVVHHQKVISYALPIWDRNHSPIGVFGLDIASNVLGDTLNLRNMYPSSFELVMTQDGKLVAAPSVDSLKADVRNVMKIINDSTYERTKSSSGRCDIATFYDLTDGDKGYIFTTSLKGGPNWQMAFVCYDSEVYGELFKTQIYIMLLMLAGFSLLGFIIYRFAQNDKRLQETQLAQERILSELRIARNIQLQMLPACYPPYPERKDLDIFGMLVPAREVGGDLYDFFLRDEELYFCIGDVSGKGIPAAMLMAVTRSLFRSASAHENNLACIMHILNETLCQGNESNMFVTFFIGALNLYTGRLRYCNAGHDKPIIINNQTAEVSMLEAKPHLPLGVFDDISYDADETALPAGSTLMLYTDGLTEAKNSRSEMYGIERITSQLNTISKTPDFTAEHMLKAISEDVDQFVDCDHLSDDLTMLAIRYTPTNNESILQEELQLKNDVRQVTLLSDFIKAIIKRLNMDISLGRNLRLGVEEAVVNVISYAYPPGTEGSITVRCQSNGQSIKFVIMDSGTPFDPTEAIKTDTTLSAEERPLGGLGILLLRDVMDTVNYERKNGMNILTMEKNLNK